MPMHTVQPAAAASLAAAAAAIFVRFKAILCTWSNYMVECLAGSNCDHLGSSSGASVCGGLPSRWQWPYIWAAPIIVISCFVSGGLRRLGRSTSPAIARHERMRLGPGLPVFTIGMHADTARCLLQAPDHDGDWEAPSPQCRFRALGPALNTSTTSSLDKY